MIDKVMMKSFDFKDKMLKESISKLDKEVRVTLYDCQQIGEDIAARMELPMDKWAIRTRHEFCENVYFACIRLVTYQNEMSYKFVGTAVRGNLSSWYANALSIYKNAPHEWLSETEKTIINLFKSKYPLRKDELTNNEKSESLKEELLDIPDDKFDIIQNETDATFTTYDGKPFIIFYDWNLLSQVSDMLEEGAQKDEFDDSIILKYFDDYGFSDEWFVCQGLDEARPYQNNYIDDYAIIDGDIFSGDYIREYRDAARDYLTLIENNPKKINTILEDSQIEALGYKKVNDEAYENGWYGREDNPAVILKEMEEKYPNSSIIFSKDSVGPFATTFNVFVKGATNGVEESLEEDRGNFKKSVPEYLWSDVCSNRLDKVKAYFERPNAQVNRRYDRFNMEHSLIMGALRNGNLEMVDLLKSFGETILDDEQYEFDKLNLYYEENPQYVRQSDKKDTNKEELTEDTYGTKRYLVQIFDDGEWFDLNSSDDVYDAIKSGEGAVEAVYQDYRILDTEDDNEEVDVGWYLENSYILNYHNGDVVEYTFPKLTEEDKEYINEYDLTIIEENSENTVVEGRLEDILDFASDCLDYELVPDYIIEALYGRKEIDEFFSLCAELGLKTFGDLKDFADNNKNRIIVNDLLKNYDSSMSTDAFFQTLRDRVAEKDEFEYDDPLNVIKNRNRKNESLQLTEGHIVREYKGFELDWNDDEVDPDEGIANFNVYIRYNGKELTKDAYGKELVFHGFNEAKRWIDKNYKSIVMKYLDRSTYDIIDVHRYPSILKSSVSYMDTNWSPSKVIDFITNNLNFKDISKDLSTISIEKVKNFSRIYRLEYVLEAIDDGRIICRFAINNRLKDGRENNLVFYVNDLSGFVVDDGRVCVPINEVESLHDTIKYKLDTFYYSSLKESLQLNESDLKDKMYVGIWDDAQDDFITYREFNSFGDALEFASKYDYSDIKSGVVKFDTNSLFTKGFASEFDIVDGKTDLKAMQELMPKNKDVSESFDDDYEDDWEESNLYGGDLTYCPICNHKLVRDEDGDSYCPTCKEDSYSLSMKRRKNRNKDRLTEGHEQYDYKGFSIDLDDDQFHNIKRHGSGNIAVEIKIGDTVYATVNGYDAAEEWVDKNGQKILDELESERKRKEEEERLAKEKEQRRLNIANRLEEVITEYRNQLVEYGKQLKSGTNPLRDDSYKPNRDNFISLDEVDKDVFDDYSRHDIDIDKLNKNKYYISKEGTKEREAEELLLWDGLWGISTYDSYIDTVMSLVPYIDAYNNNDIVLHSIDNFEDTVSLGGWYVSLSPEIDSLFGGILRQELSSALGVNPQDVDKIYITDPVGAYLSCEDGCTVVRNVSKNSNPKLEDMLDEELMHYIDENYDKLIKQYL